MSAWRFPVLFGTILLGFYFGYRKRRELVTDQFEVKQRQEEARLQADVIKEKISAGVKDRKKSKEN